MNIYTYIYTCCTQAEEEQQRADDMAKAQHDRDERARIRALADEAPRLQKQVIRLEEEVKELKEENDHMRVQMAKQDAAMAVNLAKGPQGKRGDGWRNELDELEEQSLRENIARAGNKGNWGGPVDDIQSPQADWGGLEAADVEVRLERDFAEIPEGSKEREEFKRLFIEDIAKALGIPRELIQVNGFEEGSIIVKFTILPDVNNRDESSAPKPMDLARKLQQQLGMDHSALKEGIVTGTVISVDSRPSSAASSRQHSARARHSPDSKRTGPTYNAGAAQTALGKNGDEVRTVMICV
jgi:hypothetical protein